jgi:hypothetical protein
MPDTPGRQLQTRFSKTSTRAMHRSLWLGQSELRASRRSAHFGDRQLGPVRHCLPNQCLATAHLWCPAPATPTSRERRRIQCETATPSLAERRRVGRSRLSPATDLPTRARRQPQPAARSNEHDDIHRPLQSTQSPSTLARTIANPAPRRFSRCGVAPCGARRRGTAPAVLDRSQRRARHGSRLQPGQASRSPALASTHWSVARRSDTGLGPPRARRANDEPSVTGQDAFHRAGSVRLYSSRSSRVWLAFACLARASCRPRSGAAR